MVLGKASNDDNVISQSLVLLLVTITVHAKGYQNNPLNSSQDMGPFSLFQNLELGKASTDDVISQSHGRDLVNINVYAKFHHNIPLSSRDRSIFTLLNSELGKASTDDKYHFEISWARSCQYQCVCKISSQHFILSIFNLTTRSFWSLCGCAQCYFFQKKQQQQNNNKKQQQETNKQKHTSGWVF